MPCRSQNAFGRGLVHNLASDAHDPEHRSPQLARTLEDAVREMPELEPSLGYLTSDVPRAILAGEPVRGMPPVIEPKRGVLSRLRRR